MRSPKGLTCQLALALAAAAWAAGIVVAAEPDAATADVMVQVAGELEVYAGGQGLGLVRLDDGRCFDLALPSVVLKNSPRWSGKRVSIRGSLQFRPRLDEFMWFDIKDRKIEGFGCSEDVIYVERIERLEG